MAGTLDVSEALKRYRILAASAVAVSGPADTNENILATINIPAGAMGLNGILRITTVWSITNSANNKTLRIRLGGIGGTAHFALVTTTSAMHFDTRMIANRNAANSQVSFHSASLPPTSNGAAIAGSIDTSVAQTLVITGQKASAGETITLESYLVELLRPDLGLA